jgi:5'-deoxynucleotidase YfbR-like HD superfamily hydrolase
MSNEWEEMLASARDAQRLDYVTRYTSIPVVTRETVSTHSFWVSLYSQMIYNSLGLDNGILLGAILAKANIHDLVEMRSGDFVRTFKYKTKTLKDAVDEAEEALKEEFEEPLKKLYATAKSMAVSTSEELVEAIVKAADFLSLANYMDRELLRSNYEVVPFFERMVKDLHHMTTKKNSYEWDGTVYDLTGIYEAMHNRSKHLLMLVPRHYAQASQRKV